VATLSHLIDIKLWGKLFELKRFYSKPRHWMARLAFWQA
jgi:hypothetical protein